MTNIKIFKPLIVSFTGIDEFVEFNTLKVIFKYYPNIEFGICFNLDDTEGNVMHKVQQFSELPWTAHLSEKCVEKILTDENVDFLKKVDWRRIQFNADWSTISCNAKIIEKIRNITERVNPKARCIIPDNFYSRKILQTVDLPDELDILSDVSRGKGVSPSVNNNWPAPYHPRFGYAGNIGPDNIINTMKNINQFIKKEEQFFWIDMESSLKCKITKAFQADRVLQILEKLDVRKMI